MPALIAQRSPASGVNQRHPLLAFYASSIGKKWIVALTGLGLLGFVIGHLLGNLQFLLPNHEQINDYAVHLQGLGPLLWAVRIGLLFIFVLHIVTTIRLVLQNNQARPDKYVRRKPIRSTAASRTMTLSGLLVLSFVIYHVLHFTFMAGHPEYRGLHDPAGRHDVYSMMVLGFSSPLVAGFYILSIVLLCLHLNHGIASTTQTLGLNTHRLAPLFSGAGRTLSILIGIGYLSMPLAVLAGWKQLPPWFQAAH